MVDLPRLRLSEGAIYPITHRGFTGFPHEEQVRRLLRAGAKLIQVREKEPKPDFPWDLRRCAELCREAGASLIVNDDPEAALAAGAAGVHLGQEDASPGEVRRRVGDLLLIGLSTHNTEQLRRALSEPVDYIAVGPVFGTTTKENPDPATGMHLVREAADLVPRTGKRLVVIGGITPRNLPDLLQAAPMAIPAVIGGIMKAPDIGLAYQTMQRVMEDALHGQRPRRSAPQTFLT
ncbi:MAG: thiamine phosphate synthase [Sumerlaeia bacterium]